MGGGNATLARFRRRPRGRHATRPKDPFLSSVSASLFFFPAFLLTEALAGGTMMACRLLLIALLPLANGLVPVPSASRLPQKSWRGRRSLGSASALTTMRSRREFIGAAAVALTAAAGAAQPALAKKDCMQVSCHSSIYPLRLACLRRMPSSLPPPLPPPLPPSLPPPLPSPLPPSRTPVTTAHEHRHLSNAQDCVQNCNRVAPASGGYCATTCDEYCEQPDREDGLSGSVGG